MISFTLDAKKGMGIISGDMLEDVREFFSVKNEAAFFMRKKYGRFLPQRTYAITPAGKFEPGLYFEIRKYLTNNQYVGNVTTDEQLFNTISPSRKWTDNPQFSSDIISLS